MLKEFQEHAIKVLEETNTHYNVEQNFTTDDRHVSDTIHVKELPEPLKEIGYYLSVKANKVGYYCLYQPTIPYSQGQQYGFIPEDMLEQIIK